MFNRKQEQRAMKTTLHFFLALLFVFFIACQEGPDKAFHTFMGSAVQGDWGTFYDLLDSNSQKVFATYMKKLRFWPEFRNDKNITERLARLEGREVVVYAMTNLSEIGDSARVISYEFLNKEEILNMAYMKARIKFIKGEQTKTIKMVREDEQWKVDYRSFSYAGESGKDD
jgi:hypothetical protein